MVTQFYIIEIQQLTNGEFAHLVHWVWDKDPDKARLKADSKYHEVLAAAALSNTLKHSAIIISDESFPCEFKCYKHDVQFEPTPEPEAEPVEETPTEE